MEGTAYAVSLERAESAKNWLGNIPNFITSSSCLKGKSVILGPASSTSHLQPGRGSSRVLPARPSGPRSKENVCHFPEPALIRWEMYEWLTLEVSLIRGPLSQTRSVPSLTPGCQAPVLSLVRSGCSPQCSSLSVAGQGGQGERDL